jgi:hypothetical protein
VIALTVRYPEDYPDEAPTLDVTAGEANAVPHPNFSVSEDREALLRGLEDVVRENLGIAMVFTLVSALKEAAEQLILDRRAAAARAREEELLAAERAENAKFHGTPVTKESFLKWREGFLKEIEEQRLREEEERLAELKKARGPKEPARLTGRQLWERGLAGKVDEGEDDGADDGELEGEVEKLTVEG